MLGKAPPCDGTSPRSPSHALPSSVRQRPSVLVITCLGTSRPSLHATPRLGMSRPSLLVIPCLGMSRLSLLVSPRLGTSRPGQLTHVIATLQPAEVVTGQRPRDTVRRLFPPRLSPARLGYFSADAAKPLICGWRWLPTAGKSRPLTG